MNDFNDFKKFCIDHKGAIIGGLVAIIIAFTGLRNVLIALLIIIAGAWCGNYIHKNKEKVKETLKNFIDRF